jgi:hypothetical protein
MKFCGNCAAPFASRCSHCGFENPPTFKFCGQCGNPLQAKTLARSASPGDGRAADRSIRITRETPLADVPEEERKTMTALFADIRGSMDLMEELDPEEARAIVDPALRLMIDSVHHSRFESALIPARSLSVRSGPTTCTRNTHPSATQRVWPRACKPSPPPARSRLPRQHGS